VIPTHRLITIPISHYCEKARWALDYAGVDYVEEAHLQMFHWVPARLAGGGRTVPVLTTPKGTLRESSDIVRYADTWSRGPKLFDDGDAALAKLVDRLDRYGVWTRLWVYREVLPHKDVVLRFGREGVPRWQHVAMPAALPVISRALTRFLRIDERTYEKALKKIDETFSEVEALLADGRPFLMGERFTAADLTFAALTAPLIMPPQYGVKLPQPDDLPEVVGAKIAAWRVRPAGGFAMRLFRDHRRAVA